MRRRALAALVASIALAARAEAQGEAPVASATVPKDAWALVDGAPISKDAVARRARLAGAPPAALLETMVTERVCGARLEREGFPPGKVTAEEIAGIRSELRATGLDVPVGDADVEASLRTSIAFRKCVERDATEDALRACFERRKLDLAGEVRARHILIATRTGDPAALERAKKVLDSIAPDGSNFAAVARSDSEDPTAALDGGDLDWFPRSPLARRPAVHVYEPVARACFEQGKPGLVPKPVLASDGFHVVWVTGTRFPAGEPTYDSQKERVRRLFLIERGAELVKTWRAEAKVVFAEDAPR